MAEGCKFARRLVKMSEHERLLALQSTKLMDTAREERFDRITRMAAKSLDAEVALITLLDEDRQWFKSSCGLDESTTETPRNISFCHHAIKHEEIMVVLDALNDARFKANPLVTEYPFIRFYAGAPLITTDGHTLGTLCLLDSQPRNVFGDSDRQMLNDLAASVMTEIELTRQKRALDDLSLVNKELMHRMGNMYAHVSALVALMGRDESDTKSLVKRIRSKISMLAQTQALLAGNNWTSIPLSSLISTSLAPFVSRVHTDRVSIQQDGDIQISPRGAFILSLMFNELGTNAVKHGALGVGEGKLSLVWHQTGDAITFEWRESLTAPREDTSPGTGFGSQILKRIVPMDLQGQADYQLTETGFNYIISGKTERLLDVTS